MFCGSQLGLVELDDGIFGVPNCGPRFFGCKACLDTPAAPDDEPETEPEP